MFQILHKTSNSQKDPLTPTCFLYYYHPSWKFSRSLFRPIWSLSFFLYPLCRRACDKNLEVQTTLEKNSDFLSNSYLTHIMALIIRSPSIVWDPTGSYPKQHRNHPKPSDLACKTCWIIWSCKTSSGSWEIPWKIPWTIQTLTRGSCETWGACTAHYGLCVPGPCTGLQPCKHASLPLCGPRSTTDRAWGIT